MFTRQFAVGEYGDMMGLGFTIYVPAADELRDLKASLWGGERSNDGSTRSKPIRRSLFP